jgi:hypothetical protein
MNKTMSQDTNIPPELLKAVPGTLGAIVALRWIAGTPLQRIASVIGGSGTSYYGGDYVAGVTGAHSGFVAWMLGLFGMALAHKVFESIAAFDIGKRLDKLLAKWGL